MMFWADNFFKKMRGIKASELEYAKMAMKAGAMVIVNEAKIRVPVLTGTLRSGIHSEPAEIKSYDVFVKIGVSTVPYAKYVEYGTSKMAERSYLRSSLHDKELEAMRVVKQVLKAKFG